MNRVIGVLSAGVLVLFSAGVLFIFLCAMFLPPPPEEPHPFFTEGFVRDGTRFRSPRFSSDGSVLHFERVEMYRNPVTQEQREWREDVTTRTEIEAGIYSPPRDLVRIEWFLHRLLLICGVISPDGEVAVSPVRAGMAFATGKGVFLKKASGIWSSVAGEGLSRELLRLNESPRGRLSHPDLLVWMDAALESVITRGIQSRLFSDAVLRLYLDRRSLREPLLELLFEAGDPEEIVRTILEISEDGLFRRSIMDRLERTEMEKDHFGRARVLLWMTGSEWVGYSIGPYLKDYLVRSLEEGCFDLLSEEDQKVPFKRMIRVLEVSHFSRLGRVLEKRGGSSAVAAWLVICRLAGETREGGPRKSRIHVAKRWWKENEARLKDLFRE